MYAPSIQFIQDAGTCGLWSFSSAFYEYFNKNIASEWMKKTNGYMMAKAAVQSNRSKRSPVMNYLKSLVIQIKGNSYIVRTIKEKVSWTDLKTARYLKTIFICLLRVSDGSRDHIVSISNTWIFDSNLDFTLPLKKESLDWCCGSKQNGFSYVGYWKMAYVRHCYQGKVNMKSNDSMKK
jgi:hypothetical protein